MFYGLENVMILSKHCRSPFCTIRRESKLNKNVCECCGSIIVPGKKICPICGSKLYQTSEPKEELSKDTQVLPNLDDLDKVLNEDDLDFDLPSALKMDKEPTPMATPPAEPVVPADPDLPDYPEEESPEEKVSLEDEFDLKELGLEEEDEPEEENREEDIQEENLEEVNLEEETVPVPPVMPKKQKPEKPQKEKKAKKADREENNAPVSAKDKAICVVLGILVALVGMYIAYRFLRPHILDENDTKKESTSATLPTPTITADKVLTLPVQGEGRFLTVRLEPENKDYKVTYVSADPSIATVTTDGWVTAVSAGKTTVTIACQGVEVVSEIHCDFTSDATAPSDAETTKPTNSETTKPSETTEPKETTEPTQSAVKELKLSHNDITMFEKGESAQLKVQGLKASQVTWSSDDPSIAEVEDGWVTAVSGGTTRIRVEYNGMEASCIVRCQIAEEETEEDTNNGGSGELTLNYTDVTLQEGESLYLRLEDSDGNAVSVSWSQGNSSVCEVNGDKITGVGSGYTEVTGTYAGVTYTCIVRVN